MRICTMVRTLNRSSFTRPSRLGFSAELDSKGGDTAGFISSQTWFNRAKKVLAGGISSSARSTTTGPFPFPLYLTHGHGPYVFDADGHAFIDYLLSYGSCILGHSDAGLNDLLVRQMASGTMFGTCNTVEVELAEQICGMVPSVEQVRFANSGSEAMCGAIRAARGFTGRHKVLKFEGHYHGWVDTLAVSNRPTVMQAGPLEHPMSTPHSQGTPPGVVQDVIICPWNDLPTLRRLLDEHGKEIAAVVAEPIVANNACIMPQPGYLEALAEACQERQIVLIFDEIVTGFRTVPGGAQELFGVRADLTVFSKALGGGLPISAFGGRRALMNLVGTNSVKHGGTYNGNPLCAAAALYTLRQLAREDVQERMKAAGQELIEAIVRSAHDCRVPCVVQGLGSMFQVIFTASEADATPLKHYRDLWKADTRRYEAFRHALLVQGIHANSSGSACWFTSAAHGREQTRIAIKAIERAMRQIS